MNILHLPSTPIFDTINQFVNGPYGPIILWTGFIIALLNCFFGYTLRKIWGTLLGILIGGAIGVGGAIYFHQSFQIILIAGAIGAFFGGTTALALYRVGLFVLCAGLTFLGLYFFFPHKIQLYHCFLRHCRNFSGCFIQYIRTYCNYSCHFLGRRHRSHVYFLSH